MLKDVKVGDRVKSVINGWGVVTKIMEDWISVRYAHKETLIYYHISGKNNMDDLYPEIFEVEKRKKWEPEGGPCFISGDGSIGMERKIPDNKPDHYKEEGRAYPTKELAEKANKMIRPYQRLVAYVLEHVPDWHNSKEDIAYVCYVYDAKEWDFVLCHHIEYIGIPMPESVAEELCEKLNSSEVML